MSMSRSVALALAVIGCGSAFAGGDPPSPQGAKAGDCRAAVAEQATQPAPAAKDGTAPGNAGSTGWSGGTGGSYVGTVPAGANPASKTYQPATARGLDLMAPQPSAC